MYVKCGQALLNVRHGQALHKECKVKLNFTSLSLIV